MVRKNEVPTTFSGFVSEHSVIVGYPCRKGNDDLPSIAISHKKGRDLTPLDIIKALKGKDLPKKYGNVYQTQYPGNSRA